MIIKFTVEGEPFGKQRPRHSRYAKKPYTPNKTTQHEQLIKQAYILQCQNTRFPDGSYIHLNVTAYMKIPKSASLKKRADMLSGALKPAKKPDWDNIGKLVSDALNGLAYNDDKNIVSAAVSKLYSDKPRMEINLWDDSEDYKF